MEDNKTEYNKTVLVSAYMDTPSEVLMAFDHFNEVRRRINGSPAALVLYATGVARYLDVQGNELIGMDSRKGDDTGEIFAAALAAMRGHPPVLFHQHPEMITGTEVPAIQVERVGERLFIRRTLRVSHCHPKT